MTEQEVYDISKRAAEATLRQFQPTIDKLRAENKALREAAQALMDSSVWNHKRRHRVVMESDYDVLAALTKEEL